MWLPKRTLRLIRYLCVWRINGSLVRLPRAYLPLELAPVLATLIAERLPTREAIPWRKRLAPWTEARQADNPPAVDEAAAQPPIPEALWPLEVVFMVYPGKQTYVQGEVLLWELKLFGESADHEFFLEQILPAMEEASYTVDKRWERPNSLWGHFDIDAVYVANGLQWEPLVREGRLDLRYRPTPWQWAEGRDDDPAMNYFRGHRLYKQLRWLTPFDLSLPGTASTLSGDSLITEQGTGAATSLAQVLEALILRLNHVLSDSSRHSLSLWDRLDKEQHIEFERALVQGAEIHYRYQDLSPTGKGVPGRWVGTQSFLSISPLFLPYLDLAAIVHIGRYTQFGCGTFLVR